MGKLISNLITWGLILLSLGTLGEMTMQVMGLAAKSSQSGLISLVKLNNALTGKERTHSVCPIP
jgi:hypothetical protein